LFDVNLGNKLALQGHALDKTDDTLAVHLVWLARQTLDESYKVLIHVITTRESCWPRRTAGRSNMPATRTGGFRGR